MTDYKVYRVFRDSNRKQVLMENLTRKQAQTIVKSTPREERSMVVFDSVVW